MITFLFEDNFREITGGYMERVPELSSKSSEFEESLTLN